MLWLKFLLNDWCWFWLLLYFDWFDGLRFGLFDRFGDDLLWRSRFRIKKASYLILKVNCADGFAILPYHVEAMLSRFG